MQEWIIKILAIACITLIAEILLPNSNLKKVVLLTTSLAMMVMMLAPIPALLKKGMPDISLSQTGIEVDTATVEEKVEKDIVLMLSDYDGYESALVRVVVSNEGSVDKITINVPSKQQGIINKDTTIKAIISALYRVREENIIIVREG
jgi:stage III sporulation protein AF